MPWYNEKLDFDLEEKLNVMQINNGIFLDLGTGPGTQAMQLSKKGFDVIGSDISETVIKRNKIMYENKYQHIKSVIDNILYYLYSPFLKSIYYFKFRNINFEYFKDIVI